MTDKAQDLQQENEEIFLEFVDETQGQLQGLEELVLGMEQGSNLNEGVTELFRVMHTIKGTSGFFGLTTVTELAHLAETLLSDIRAGKRGMSQELTDALLDTLDLLGQLLTKSDQPGHFTQIKAKLQTLVDQETQPSQNPDQAQPNQAPAEPQSLVEAAPSAAPEQQSIRLGVQVLDELLELIGEVVLGRNQLQGEFAEHALFSNLSRSITKLHRHVIQTRMQPIGSIFNRYQRMIRDLSRQTGKSVQLNLVGSEIELDRTLLEKIADPITHLIRNSVDHGLETPSERVAADKASVGQVWLRAYLESGQIILEVEDDGKGMNEQRIVEKALNMGLIDEQKASELSSAEIFKLVFLPGFSTKDQANELSGRGVGMDVVETNLRSLGFSLEIQSKAGQGTRFSARMPMTQAVVNSAVISSLIIRLGQYPFALPEMAISEMLTLGQAETAQSINKINGKDVLLLRGAVIPLIPLPQVLGQPERSLERQRRRGLFVVMQFKKNRFAFEVDEIIGTEEIVVKRLPQLLKSRGVFEGTTLLSDGSIAMILDVNGIVEQAGFSFEQSSLGNLQAISAEALEHRQNQLLLMSVAEQELAALDMALVAGIHKIQANEIHPHGRQEFAWINGRNLRLLRLDQFMDLSPLPIKEHYYIIETLNDDPYGILATKLIDHADLDAVERLEETREEGLLGRFHWNNQLVALLDLQSLQHSRAELEVLQATDTLIDNRRILLVEDTLFYRELVIKALQSFGYSQISTASNGVEALALLEIESEPFDLIISDIEMPQMNGVELAIRLKANPRFAQTPLLALTGLDQESDRQRCLQAGFDGFEVKVNRKGLLSAITDMLEDTTEANP